MLNKIDPAIQAQLLTAVITLLVALAGWIKSQSNGKKADANAAAIAQNTAVTQATHEAVNSLPSSNTTNVVVESPLSKPPEKSP